MGPKASDESHPDRKGSEAQEVVSSELEKQHQDSAPNSETAKEDNLRSSQEPKRPLYKRKALKSYITLALASFINYDAAQKSSDVIGSAGVPSTDDQRRYAVAVSLVSLVLSTAAVVGHLDRLLFERFWRDTVFKEGSRIEMPLILFLVVWWSVGTGLQTSLRGIAGDAKGQYSFYFSTWSCLVLSFLSLDAWLRESADDNGGFKAFVASWPNRAPAWLSIVVLSVSTMVWYVDLWRSYPMLDRSQEEFIREYFEGVNYGLWYWLIIVTSLTLLAALGFTIMEIFRATKEDREKQQSKMETTLNTIEGFCFAFLALAWIPTVMVATTPGGPASLVGNAYFSTWLLVIFVFEGLVWYIHDMRQQIHKSLKHKQEEYKMKQEQVLEESRRIQDAIAIRAIEVVPTARERISSSELMPLGS